VIRLARPAGAPDRKALGVSSDHPEAVKLVTASGNLRRAQR
jgi:hypothetical protein